MLSIRDENAGIVESAEGELQYVEENRQKVLRVGGVSLEGANLLQSMIEGRRCRVYFIPKLRRVVSLEALA